MDHPGALAHAAYCNGLSADLHLHCRFLLHSVCGHNGFRRQLARLQTSVKLRGHLLHACGQLLNGKLHSDHACGGHQNTVLRNMENFRRGFCRLPAVPIPLFSCAGVGDAAVAHDHLRRGMVVYDLLIPFHRSRFYHVGGKGSRRFAGILRIYHSHIGSSLIFDPRRCGSGPESFCRCYAAFDYFHGVFLISVFSVYTCDAGRPVPVRPWKTCRIFRPLKPSLYGTMGICLSPSASSNPNRRFIFCTAWPAAPFTRLSIAPIMMIRFVLGSILKFTST